MVGSHRYLYRPYPSTKRSYRYVKPSLLLDSRLYHPKTSQVEARLYRHLETTQLGHPRELQQQSSMSMPYTTQGTADEGQSKNESCRRPTSCALEIHLTEKERQIIAIVLGCIKHYALNVVVRIAGGWVRDKVRALNVIYCSRWKGANGTPRRQRMNTTLYQLRMNTTSYQSRMNTTLYQSRSNTTLYQSCSCWARKVTTLTWHSIP